ncbi:calcineurin-like phosphoesterase family protein [Chitinophaga filiformis]|uniref:calcineurin-like phosphoesterase C-terminal domain-containing protein n=1 Tax=Chitinophaga filiformis TaxID=104663 RepID=UPI001F20AD38|nr:calcineurin-like phosphoesterase family protein [Chitinophaga filiformis]MCF6404998.1 calcineurin-like phosphoesterase family protein [Chitinophaga filiformis]
MTLNRRKFLKNLSVTGSLLTLPSVMLNARPLFRRGNIDLSNITLKGKVHNKGKGIPGVQVTDGINIVLTDKNGQYELQSNATAEFVYISVPAGYAFPEEKGIANFYRPITKGSSSVKNDFSLEKLAVDDRKHSFVVWADPQMKSKKDVELLMSESVPDLQAVVKSYPKDSLIHGIGCGDLVWDEFELFADYRQAVALSGIPFFNVIGNHDMDIEARTDEGSSNTFKKQFGPTYYSYNRGEIHYIVLDDVFFVGAAKSYIGYVTENQLQWLEQDLAMVKPGSTIVLSLHIPTFTGAQRRAGKPEEIGGGTVANRKQLYKMLAPYKVHIMSGHTHFNDNWEEGNIMEHNHGTVCGAWWTGPICGDGTPGGYGVYDVDGPDIKWYYKSTGLPKEKQLRVYPKGKVKDSADEISANVWNWDNKWKVEWYEDGVLKGQMERRVAHDPWAVELYLGPQLPKKHKFVEPTLTDHMFFAKPSPDAKKITVKATDRFGNVYEESL